jgi:Fungal Zn(2)-Cys(6) binuclear cluster domain
MEFQTAGTSRMLGCCNSTSGSRPAGEQASRRATLRHIHVPALSMRSMRGLTRGYSRWRVIVCRSAPDGGLLMVPVLLRYERCSAITPSFLPLVSTCMTIGHFRYIRGCFPPFPEAKKEGVRGCPGLFIIPDHSHLHKARHCCSSFDFDYVCRLTERACSPSLRYQPHQTCDSPFSAFSSQLQSPCKLGQADMASSSLDSPEHSSPESFEVEDDSSHQASSAQWPVQGQASPDGTSTSPSQPTRTAQPMQKRRRVTRACDECRRKKIKCDGKQPCTHCTVYSYGKFTSTSTSEAEV